MFIYSHVLPQCLWGCLTCPSSTGPFASFLEVCLLFSFGGTGCWDKTIAMVWAVSVAAGEKGWGTGLSSDLGSHVLDM